MLLYRDLVPWYRLMDPVGDHADEAVVFRAAWEAAIEGPKATLLELGAGAGHNAFHLKAHFRCTLSDLSEDMLALSRDLNPECEHIAGDMRTIRLEREFDAVLVHDAIMYLLNEEDLRAAIRTAFVHLRPGGAAIFAPDCVRETFYEGTDEAGHADGDRALRYLEWRWDPDPRDTTYRVDYAILMRDGASVTPAHDVHIEGLFPRKTWRKLLESEGFVYGVLERPLGDGESDKVFLCQRPA